MEFEAEGYYNKKGSVWIFEMEKVEDKVKKIGNP